MTKKGRDRRVRLRRERWQAQLYYYLIIPQDDQAPEPPSVVSGYEQHLALEELYRG